MDGCEKAFKTSGDLQKHIRTHTGVSQELTVQKISVVHYKVNTVSNADGLILLIVHISQDCFRSVVIF